MRLRSSKLGDDFPRERFLRTPIRTIMEVLEFIDNEERRHYNLASSTTAQLCLQVIAAISGLAGGTSPRQRLKDFLPFPDWQPLDDSSKPPGPTPQTRALLTRLLRERRIPLPIYTQLISADDISVD